MEKFAFVIHPLSAKKDVARKYPIVRFFPEALIEKAMEYKSPMDVSHITGIKSITGVEAEGWFVGCALTPKLMTTLPVERVYNKIVDTVKLAEDKGAKIVGLGAFTSVVGDGGITIAERSNIAVTTGNSYTVATAIEGAKKGAEILGINPSEAVVAVVGTVLYFSLSPNPDPQETVVTVCEEQKTENQQIDTIDLAENVVSDAVTEETVATSYPSPSTVASTAQSKSQLQQTVAAETSTENPESSQPHQPKHITRTVHYRPSEILVDTISSIDFPDYKAKPADMLP